MILQAVLLYTLLFLIVVYCFYLILGWTKFTPFYPSSGKQLKACMDELNIDLEKTSFLDIGSGDGRIVHFMAQKGAKKSVGLEINPFLSLVAKIRKAILRLHNADFELQDAHKHSFEDYNVVYLYLFPEYIQKLEGKLKEELKPGSIIISRTFKLSTMEPEQQINHFNIYRI